MFKTVITLFLFVSLAVVAQKKDSRGLLPELNTQKSSEQESESQTLKSEVLISKTENKAIEALQNILKKKKGTAQEADLLNRLAELYMRKSKSGRFFDLQRTSNKKTISSFPIAQENGAEWLRKAITIYNQILAQHPKFSETDSVLFNSAFAYQQLNQKKNSEINYKALIDRFPNSLIVPDSLLALGELLYDQGRFSEAKVHFEKIENYPDSRVYVYGLYKLGWAYYNLKNSSDAIKKLKLVVEKNPPQVEASNKRGYYLRKEAIRDLVLFIGEVYQAEDLYDFFKAIVTNEELGPALFDMAKLYDSYSRLKDIHIFLNEFIKKESDNLYVVKSHILMAETYETLKKRDQVIAELTFAGEDCAIGSTWRQSQTGEQIEEICQKDFKRVSLDLTKKWWEIWQKNKTHKEFSILTETILKLIIKNEDPTNPDLKTRTILAELQFQIEKFEDASTNYYFVASHAKDKKESHDALYASLFSVEKELEIKTSEKKKDQRKQRAIEYYTRFPQGEHFFPVGLKVAVIYYEEKNYTDALKVLAITENSQEDLTVRAKSQDLVLDIYNIQKRYTDLKNLSALYLKESKDDTRTKSLVKINEESHFSEIQLKNKDLKPLEQTTNLVSYFESHKGSELGMRALLDALKIYLENKSLGNFTDSAEELLKRYPLYDKKTNLIKDLINSYTDLTNLKKAGEWSLKLAAMEKGNKNLYTENAADLFLLEGQNKEARTIYQQLLNESPKDKRIQLFAKIKSTLDSSKDQQEIQKINGIILELNIEPFATEVLTEKATRFYNDKNYKDAFELTMKILKRDSASEHRAKARFIQGQILEQEYFAQSMKTSKEERLALIIQLKTERLEKAQTAYLSVTKMTNSAELVKSSFEAIDRCYAHYIESLSTMPLPETLSANEQNELRGEIKKLLVPIEHKRKENLSAIGGEIRGVAAIPNSTSWVDAAAETSTGIELGNRYGSFLTLVIPKTPAREGIRLFSLSDVSDCRKDAKDISLALIYSCAEKSRIDQAEIFANQLANKESSLELIQWANAFLAFKKEQYLKAQWIFEKMRKETQNNIGLIDYNIALLKEKAKTNTTVEVSLDSLANLNDEDSFMGLYSRFLLSYKSKDYKKIDSIHSRLMKQREYTENAALREYLIPLIAESLSQVENTEKAIKTLDSLPVAQWKNPDVLYFSKARIYEVFKNSTERAIYFYDLANKETRLADKKSWLARKLDFLKTKKH
ncbi:MAG: tetratricopeptide repeat protein [Bdellovibrionaceae bacterium]|nr:tetratricopeptide repeat protein [Pseudobdellovibrionaceae bacterium]